MEGVQEHRREGLRKMWSVLRLGPGRSLRPVDLVATASFAAGGVLLLWSAYIHFHLWGETDGYRSIPTIGTLFLLQSIAGLVIGLGVIALRQLWASVVGFGFAVATIAGFLVSVTNGLFAFKESWLAPFAKQAFTIEVVAAAMFVVAAALCLVPSPPRVRPDPSGPGHTT
jgi:hypothetical protein